MTIKIVTDSTCDLPESVVIENGITVVPCYINMNGQSYLDGVELSRREFYERLPGLSAVPTTSAPGLGTFIQVYKQLLAEGASGIISIHISASLSNVFNVASLAAQQISELPVIGFNAGQLTLGTGVLVLAAAEAATSGSSMEEIIALLKEMTLRTHSFAALDTLEYLRRSGRVSGLQNRLGTLLQIKPILKMHAGNIAFERRRTNEKSIQRLINLVSDLGPLEQLSLVHTHAPQKVERLRQQAQHLFPPDKAPLCVEVTPAIGAHTGPGAVGFVCVSAG